MKTIFSLECYRGNALPSVGSRGSSKPQRSSPAQASMAPLVPESHSE